MNYTTRLLFTTVCSFLFFSTLFAQHTITSDAPDLSFACDGDCFTYTVQDGIGGPYFWITDGTIQGNNNEEEAIICWTIIGENDIQVVDFAAPFINQSTFQSVNVLSIPKPEVRFPLYPECVVSDSLHIGYGQEDLEVIECKTVCSGSTATYTAIAGIGSTIEWEIEGGIILSQSQEEITIEWNTIGVANIKITETNNGCVGVENYCIEILEPLDVDIVALNGTSNEISICLGQTVYFQGIGSNEVTNYGWDFGNNTFAIGGSASGTYEEAGTYTVTLVGSTECGCSATSEYTVIVDSNPGPEIMCTGTVCGGDEQTYFASENCTDYTWTISSNGTITEGGGANDDYVVVTWNTGPVGDINLSTSGCDTPVCALTTTVQIPIIDGNAVIDGPAIVCKDGYAKYSVQYYNGADYNWTLAGNGQIIDGHRTNEITIRWDDSPNSPDQSTIDVYFDNCYLECGGQASLIVDLLPKFELASPGYACTDQTTYISATEGWNGATVDFEIIDPLGTSSLYPSVSFVSETFTIPGEYTVIATDAQSLYCNDQVLIKFQVIEKPSDPASISGPLSICKDEYYVYSVLIPSSEYNVRWIVKDGSTTTFQYGSQISIQWASNGPYEITVNYYHNDGGCSSEAFQQVIIPVANTAISGYDVACVDETSNYSTGIASGSSATWMISPSDAGSIKLNSDNTIDITWHLAGTHQINLDFCGASLIYNVTVNPLPSTLVDFPEKVCSGEMATITIPVTSSTVSITDESDNVISTDNISVVIPGNYKAVITTSAGCEEIVPIVIDTFIAPSIRVSSPHENAYCLPHTDISIVALDTEDGYTYEWFHDGLSLGITAPQILTTDYGDYHVIVTDQNGCTAISNIHTLYEWCTGDQPPGTCSGAGNNGLLQISATSLTCNDLQFGLKGSIYASTSFTWVFGDPDSGLDNFATGSNPIHSFTNAGYYYVFLQGNIPNERAVEIFTVPAAPRFDYDLACVNSGVQFNNQSTFIPGIPILQYSWDFGDAASGSDNLSFDKDPVHIYSTPGNYTVTLEITGNDGCLASYQLEVEVLGGPFGDFLLPSSSCSDEGLLFTAYQSPDILSYTWDFGDPSSGAANMSTSSNAIHTFSTNGTYNVSLLISDIHGCTSVISKQIAVTTTSISGSIVVDKSFPICFGEEVTLDAPSGGLAYLWSNGESTQSITTTNPGIYSVTIADPSGCRYTPDEINVSVEGVINRKITASIIGDEYNYFSDRYFDSIKICEGEIFSFNATYINGATYNWSMGSSTNWNNYSNDFPQLAPGTHDMYVTITDPLSGCAVESEPFKIIVNAIPDPVSISASNNNCAGEINTFTVDNPQPNMTYYWNNGEVGTSMTTSLPGLNKVTAVNSNGCERHSQNIIIPILPDANRINLGCTTACFPDTICFPDIIDPITLTSATQQWLLDGSPINTVSGGDLIVNQAGDYQLVVYNFFGCTDTSDIFTIDAEPNDQSITGVVFIDENMNGVWDNGEELLSGVPVHIYEGNSIESSTTTDALGLYLFDPINIVNPIVTIDTVGLGLNLTGGIFEANVNFESCIEDKLQDFPLIKVCPALEVNQEVYVCVGTTTIIESIVLAEGDTWTFTNLTQDGCDSLTNVEIIAFEAPVVELIPSNTCMNQNGGQLEINIMNGGPLQFSIDNTTSISSDLNYTGLSEGNHMLWLFDANGCSASYPFTIDVLPVPEMSSIVDAPCAGGDNGSIQMSAVTSGSYEYSLDGISFSADSYFDGLSVGMTSIYTMDLNTGCIYEHTIDINPKVPPEVELISSSTCAGMADGSITISPITSGNYQFSLDGITFSDELFFSSLAAGVQSVYIIEDGTCMTSLSVNIVEEPEPLVIFETEEACAGIANGQIIINGTNLSYSLDQDNFLQDTIIQDLPAGSYEIYILGEDNCVHPFEVEVEESTEMDVTFIDPEVDCSITAVVLSPMVQNEVGNVSYVWSDGTNGESITTTANGTYDVEVSDKCTTRSYSYDVELEEIIEEQPIYFPNIFSPDDNGINDCFVPALNPQTQIISYRLLIFDRWGNKYFETSDIMECWDGTNNGQDVRAGVFVYLVELEYTYCMEVESIKKAGDITVLD